MSRAATPSIAALAGPRLSVRGRRLLALAITVLGIELVWCARQQIDAKLGHASVMTGAALLACLWILLAIGLRRRLAVLPLGSMSVWTQVHLHTGLFATAVFLMHVPAVIASGWFEGTLSWLFLAVAVSGFYGAWANRSLPRRMTTVSIQPRYDQIGRQRDQQRRAAADVYHGLPPAAGAAVLGDFYRRRLSDYFAAGTSLAMLALPRPTRRRRLLAELDDLRRYLDAGDVCAADQWAGLIRQRDELDYHHALQFRLRCWVAGHAALSLLLVVCATVHAVLAWSMIRG